MVASDGEGKIVHGTIVLMWCSFALVGEVRIVLVAIHLASKAGLSSIV